MKLGLLSAFAVIFVSAGSVRAAAVSEFVNSYIQRHHIPGVAVMVRANGALALSQGFGIANLEHNVAVTPQTVFQTGSIAKQFTAAAVMILVDEGKLSLSDPLSKYIEVPASWSGITVRHLLTHTSGLGDYPADYNLRADYTEADLLRIITAQPLAFMPGEQWHYSNLGYVTLGILIRKISGQFYGDFLRDRVFVPLGMKNTRVISEADIIPNRAAGYRMRDGVIQNQSWVSPSVNTTADGSLYITIEDMARWDEALDAGKIIGPSGWQQAWTPVALNNGATAPYGFGWGIDKTRSGHAVIRHGGAWQGFTAHYARYPDDHLSVAVLCNLAACDAGYIAHRIAGLFHPDLAPAIHTRAHIDPAVLKTYAGKYQEHMTLEITVEGETLIFTLMGQRIVMIPESDSTFFEEDSDRTLRFEKDTDGHVTAMILSVPEEIRFQRLP